MMIIAGPDSYIEIATSLMECHAYVRSYELIGAHLCQQTLYSNSKKNPVLEVAYVGVSCREEPALEVRRGWAYLHDRRLAGAETARVDTEVSAMRMKNVPRWIWPLGLAAAGIGAAGAVLLRGCWHRNMSWPIRHGEYAYRTCNDCGINRLFDENTFRLFGPYGYDVDELIALHRVERMKRMRKSGLKETETEESPATVAKDGPKTGTEQI